MYSIGKKYKFQVNVLNDNVITYTGFVVSEDNICIKIKTVLGEELIIAKEHIIQGKRVVE